MKIHLNGIIRNDAYRLYHCPYVETHQESIIGDCERGYTNYREIFNRGDLGTTRDYKKYNIFSLTPSSVHFYTIFLLLTSAIRDYVGDDRPLWMQSWMNRHTPDEVLDWHDHHEHNVVHGYLSIDPKSTVTEFKNYSIENKVGTLYLGKSGKDYSHRVQVLEPYDGYRVTLAFDVIDSLSLANVRLPNLSFIPIP